MNQFTFTSKERNFTLGLILLGVVCMLLTAFTGDADYRNARFWSNFLHNSVFFLGISFVTFLLMCAHIAATSGWHTVFKRAMEAMSAFIPVGGILIAILIIATFLHWHPLYHWTDAGITDPASDNYDKIIAGKKGFLNMGFFTVASVLFVGSWWWFARKIRAYSIKMDETGDIKNYKRTKTLSAIFLPIGGVSSAALIWFWVMSTEPHWYSTLYAWYGLASWLVTGVSILVLILYYLKSQGYYKELLPTHVHDLGKYIFGFSIFWTYLWFSQFMLIWYGNIGEETVHFQYQRENFPILFWAILALNFVLPFLILMRNSTKWKQGSMIFVSILVILGHWIDYFLMIKPGVLHSISHHGGEHHEEASHGEHTTDAAHHGGEHVADHAEHAAEFVAGFNLPGLLELGTMLGFLGLFLFIVFRALEKAPLVPKYDPFLEESLTHVGGPLGPEIHHHDHEHEEAHH